MLKSLSNPSPANPQHCKILGTENVTIRCRGRIECDREVAEVAISNYVTRCRYSLHTGPLRRHANKKKDSQMKH